MDSVSLFVFVKRANQKKYVKQCREVNHPGSGMTDDGSRYYLTGGLGAGRGRSGENPHKNAKKFSVSLRAHHYSQYRRARRKAYNLFVVANFFIVDSPF